jgi:hypothetical protein
MFSSVQHACCAPRCARVAILISRCTLLFSSGFPNTSSKSGRFSINEFIYAFCQMIQKAWDDFIIWAKGFIYVSLKERTPKKKAAPKYTTTDLAQNPFPSSSFYYAKKIYLGNSDLCVGMKMLAEKTLDHKLFLTWSHDRVILKKIKAEALAIVRVEAANMLQHVSAASSQQSEAPDADGDPATWSWAYVCTKYRFVDTILIQFVRKFSVAETVHETTEKALKKVHVLNQHLGQVSKNVDYVPKKFSCPPSFKNWVVDTMRKEASEHQRVKSQEKAFIQSFTVKDAAGKEITLQVALFNCTMQQLPEVTRDAGLEVRGDYLSEDFPQGLLIKNKNGSQTNMWDVATTRTDMDVQHDAFLALRAYKDRAFNVWANCSSQQVYDLTASFTDVVSAFFSHLEMRLGKEVGVVYVVSVCECSFPYVPFLCSST